MTTPSPANGGGGRVHPDARWHVLTFSHMPCPIMALDEHSTPDAAAILAILQRVAKDERVLALLAMWELGFTAARFYTAMAVQGAKRDGRVDGILAHRAPSGGEATLAAWLQETAGAIACPGAWYKWMPSEWLAERVLANDVRSILLLHMWDLGLTLPRFTALWDAPSAVQQRRGRDWRVNVVFWRCTEYGKAGYEEPALLGWMHAVVRQRTDWAALPSQFLSRLWQTLSCARLTYL